MPEQCQKRGVLRENKAADREAQGTPEKQMLLTAKLMLFRLTRARGQSQN
jgi:hypothetical protein